MLKIRRPLGRLIFNMGIAIPGKTIFLIETAPWSPMKGMINMIYKSHANKMKPFVSFRETFPGFIKGFHCISRNQQEPMARVGFQNIVSQDVSKISVNEGQLCICKMFPRWLWLGSHDLGQCRENRSRLRTICYQKRISIVKTAKLMFLIL